MTIFHPFTIQTIVLSFFTNLTWLHFHLIICSIILEFEKKMLPFNSRLFFCSSVFVRFKRIHRLVLFEWTLVTPLVAMMIETEQKMAALPVSSDMIHRCVCVSVRMHLKFEQHSDWHFGICSRTTRNGIGSVVQSVCVARLIFQIKAVNYEWTAFINTVSGFFVKNI